MFIIQILVNYHINMGYLVSKKNQIFPVMNHIKNEKKIETKLFKLWKILQLFITHYVNLKHGKKTPRKIKKTEIDFVYLIMKNGIRLLWGPIIIKRFMKHIMKKLYIKTHHIFKINKNFIHIFKYETSIIYSILI